MKPKSGKTKASKKSAPAGDVLTDAARAIGSALGSIAAKAKTASHQVAGTLRPRTKKKRARRKKRA